MATKLIRFDWAMKKILRHKANYGILEGFLSELLFFDVKIESILESEGNKDTRDDKSNRVDILVRSTKGELMLVEVQNDSEVDYFHRMLYGVSTLATEYIKEGERYGTIRKIYSINIVYFGLGQGDDYVYEYKGNFVGMHKNDILLPTAYQRKKYSAKKVADIFPKYYILKVNNFDEVAKNTLDEWIYFLKNSEVKESFSAKGLDQAREKLLYEQLSEDEKIIYKREQKEHRIARSVEETAMIEAKIKLAKKLFSMSLDDDLIAEATEFDLDFIQILRNEEEE
jgi:predicted transposase/invertase (TIGR01784 family)